MTPDQALVRRGELVTFRVVVTNVSGEDYLRDNASGGVGLVISLPRGFVYKPGSGRVETVAGATLGLLDPDTATAELLLVRDLEGVGQHLNLGRGQGLTFRYQLVAASPVQGDTVARHRTFLQGANGAALSGVHEVSIRVEADPEFDQGLVFGRVFCDRDGDGEHDEDEAGVGGVRVVADTGWVADTDRAGLVHFRKLQPGNHLFKVDAATLPPGVTLSEGGGKALLYITRGLVAKARFPVRCEDALEEVSPSEVKRVDAGGVSAATDVEVPTEPLGVVTLVGDADKGTVAVDARPVPTLVAGLTVEGRGRTADGQAEQVRSLNVPWRPGRLARPLVFRPEVRVDGPAAGLTWQLRITKVERFRETLVREMAGQGAPPDRVTWDGTEPGLAGVSVLDRGALYQARLVLSDGRSGVAVSAPVMLGASHGADRDELWRRVERGALFDAAMKPKVRLMTALRRAKKALDKAGGARLLVKVHTDATPVPETDMTRTRRAAYLVREWLVDRLGMDKRQVLAVGLGGTRPLRPNVGERNRAFNRRVEIVVLPADEAAALKAPEAPKVRASLRVQDQQVPVEADGTFVATVPRPNEGRPLAVLMESADGARRMFALGSARRSAVAPLSGSSSGREAAEAAAPMVDEHGALVVPDEVAPPPVGLVAPRDAKVEVSASGEGADGGEVVAGQPLVTDPLRRFGGRALREAIGARSVLLDDGDLVDGAAVTAGKLKVRLPPKGVALSTTRLFVDGTSDPANTLTINGDKVRVRADGGFDALVQVPSGSSDLVIVSRDGSGHEARITWPVTVKDSELFLLVLADGAAGQVGARLEELGPYHQAANDSFFLAGRGAVYAKGRVSGGDLVKDLFVTAHIDTAKRRDFEAFYAQVVDPARDYVVFGDASEDVQDATARGPLYLLVEADRSKLRLGSFRTDLRGVHLLRYNRTFYGGELDLDAALAQGYRTRLKAFVSEDNRKLVRRHDELRATGGSLYYLSSREIVEGSEQVSVVVRELDTGLELGTAKLRRDAHYRVDYLTGRVTFSSPVSSTMDPLFQIDGFQPFTGRSVMDGHEVWIVVDYESRAVTAGGDIVFGVHGSQQVAGIVEVGGGYVREGRPTGLGESGGTPYELYGAHAKVKLSASSTAFVEWAESKQIDGLALASTDGGLDYRSVSRATGETKGYALKMGLDAQVGELLAEDALKLRVKGWWQHVEPGFHATGLAYQQGREHWGGEVSWLISDDDRLDLRYDGGTVLIPDFGYDTNFRAYTRDRVRARYSHDFGPVEATAEGAYGQHRDDDDGEVYDGGAWAVGARWRATPKLSAILSQEGLIGVEDEVVGGEGFAARMTTNVGLDYRLSDDLSLRVLESLRWNGENATRIGVKTRLDDRSSVYFEDRLKPGEGNGRLVHSLVVGGESLLDADGSGRAYGEYRLDTGVGGRTNRAVVGLGKWFELAPGVRLVGAYERSQAMGGLEAGASRDTLSAGLEMVTSDAWKFGGLYEVRWDRPTSDREKVQALIRNALDVKLSADLTAMGIFNYTMTQDLDSRHFDKEDLEATVALVWRPIGDDDLTFVARYSNLIHRDSTYAKGLGGLNPGELGGLSGHLAGERIEERKVSNLVSLAAIIELPWRLQLTEKVAFRHTLSRASGVAEGSYDVLLWINRVAFHLVKDLDVAGELRLMATFTDEAITENGGLFEVAYTFADHVRLGVGYHVNGVADWLLPGEESNDIAGGLYMRLTGTY